MARDQIEATEKVANLDVQELINILIAVLDRKREGGDNRLIDMTIKDFTTLMLDQLKNRAMATATAETAVAERVLTDWKGLQDVEAIAQPFRIKTAKQAVEFGRELAESLTVGQKAGSVEYVVAVAVVNPNGTYQPTNGLGLSTR